MRSGSLRPQKRERGQLFAPQDFGQHTGRIGIAILVFLAGPGQKGTEQPDRFLAQTGRHWGSREFGHGLRSRVGPFGLAVVQHDYRFSAGDGDAPAGAANDLSDGRGHEILSAGDFISLLDDGLVAVLERVAWIDLRAVFAVREQAVAVGVDASGDGSPVDVRGGGINGVMLAESDAFSREFPKRGSLAFGDRIGAHAVPDDHDDVAIVGRRSCFGKERCGEKVG